MSIEFTRYQFLEFFDNDLIRKLQSTLPEAKRLARQQGKILEFHSKYPIPDQLKSWFIKNDIIFFEG